MCGIFGIVSYNHPVNTDAVAKATRLLSHRGPDDFGTYFSSDKKVGLGHTRLSILDLSQAAHQPICSPCGRYIMVYNGEVYNFKTLRRELQVQHNISFQSSGDTEVILHAFKVWGSQFACRLNGMFALAIWDNQEQKLFLCRDRMGIKPLYVYQKNNQLIFSSELKSIINYPSVKHDLTLNQKSFYAFMHLGYIPEPFSVYENITKFPAANFGEHSAESPLKTTPYWDLQGIISNERTIDETTATDQLSNLLHESVKRRMVSDVPVGTFLSGGIDSSLITSIAAQYTSELHSFSIGFEEATFDESQYAKKVAQHIGTNHTEFILSEKEAIPLLEGMTSTFDEPFADTSAIPMMLISKLASQHVKVILTGDGGDEQFLGYGSYTWANRLSTPLLRSEIIKKGALHMLSKGNNRMKRVANLFAHTSKEGIRNHIFSQEQYFFANPEFQRLFHKEDPSFHFVYTDPNINCSAAEKQAFFDLRYYLKDDLLVKVDRSSMRYGLECRVPFLDHELLAFTQTLDKKLKARNGEAKYLLKKVLYQHVPPALFDRPKWGFSIPLAKWLTHDMHYLIDDHLNEKSIHERGFFNFETVDLLLKRFKTGEDYLYNRIWLIILWQKWAQENNIFNG
ncbi:MAG: asparagine synthase (glutamine-hydrolyzing) [Cyclobacteriaceae bacterium]